MPEETARFYIDVPLPQLDLVDQLLNKAGVQFCPIENMVCLPKENLLDGIFTGADAGYAIEQLNEKLYDIDDPEHINLEFFQMNPETRRDFLNMVTLDMSWESDYEPTLLELEPSVVTRFLQQHPETGTATPQEEAQT